MQYTLFAGCSYTAGIGFFQEKANPDLWVNILHKSVPELAQTQLINTAQGGRSNAGIFSDTAYNLTKHDCKYAFVAWTSCPRYELELGFETYDTRQCFIPNAPTRDHNLNICNYSSSYLDKVRDRFVSLAHLQYEIHNLVCYVNSLVAIAKLTGTKIFFINAICPWDNHYFDKLENCKPESYTSFTKKEILNIESRDDEEIFALYNKMHNQYNQYGGIQDTHWLNLYQSMRRQKIDTNTDGSHPGKLSNKLYAERFSLEFINRI